MGPGPRKKRGGGSSHEKLTSEIPFRTHSSLSSPSQEENKENRWSDEPISMEITNGKVSRVRPNSCSSDHSSSSAASRMAKALSTISNSSKSTMESHIHFVGSKRASLLSTATVQHSSRPSIESTESFTRKRFSGNKPVSFMSSAATNLPNESPHKIHLSNYSSVEIRYQGQSILEDEAGRPRISDSRKAHCYRHSVDTFHKDRAVQITRNDSNHPSDLFIEPPSLVSSIETGFADEESFQSPYNLNLTTYQHSSPQKKSRKPAELLSPEKDNRNRIMGNLSRRRESILSSLSNLSHSLSRKSKKPSMSEMRTRFLAMSPSSSSLVSVFKSSPSEPSDVNTISLPTPSDASREKLRNKLKSSNSLLSLTRSNEMVPSEEYEKNLMKTLLDLCNERSIISFENYVRRISQNDPEFLKISESSFSAVYARAEIIYKIIPFGDEILEQLPISDLIQELNMCRLLKDTTGFLDLIDISVVRGRYPESLLRMWDSFAEKTGFSSRRPDVYSENQLFCILSMKDAGTDLESYKIESWRDAEKIFWGVVKSVKQAEERFHFEHRDLHLGNIVVSKQIDGSNKEDQISLASENSTEIQETIPNSNISGTSGHIKVTLIDLTLSRADSADGQVFYTRLDHPEFFKGRGDSQFDIYRMMRSLICKKDNLNPRWSDYHPQTNVMWLHYLVEKLLHNKGLSPVTISCPTIDNRSELRYQSDLSRHSDAAAMGNLLLISDTLNPERRRTGKRTDKQQMYFQDFHSAKQVYAWGKHERLVDIRL